MCVPVFTCLSAVPFVLFVLFVVLLPCLCQSHSVVLTVGDFSRKTLIGGQTAISWVKYLHRRRGLSNPCKPGPINRGASNVRRINTNTNASLASLNYEEAVCRREIIFAVSWKYPPGTASGRHVLSPASILIVFHLFITHALQRHATTSSRVARVANVVGVVVVQFEIYDWLMESSFPEGIKIK